MREARLILPNSPEHHGVALWLRGELAKEFGGYTETIGNGGWIAPNGELIAEPVRVFDVAVHELVAGEHNITLRAIAEHVRVRAHQQAVYLRLPSGNVEFIEAPAR